MTPEAFILWLAAMKAAGLARSDAAAARLLGVSANSVVAFKRQGADRRTALACNALFEGLDPWHSGHASRAVFDAYRGVTEA